MLIDMALRLPQSIQGFIEKPLSLGAWGLGSGLATMGLSEAASKSEFWANYDALIFRLGATGAFISVVVSIIIQLYRLRKIKNGE